MPEHSARLRLLCLVIGMAGLLWWGSSPSDPVAAEPPDATPPVPSKTPGSVFILPPPRPTDVPDSTFRPLLTVPFAPILPDLSSLTLENTTGARSATSPSPQDWPEATPTPRTVETNRASLPEVEMPEGLINVLLLGTDRRPGWGDWRTDTIIVVSINPEAGSIAMLSIPRDLWVRIPGYGVGRINTVDFIGEWKGAEGGGPGLMKRTIEENLGLPIHRYVRIDLEGFVRIIDALGGVTIDVDCPIRDVFLDTPLTGEEGPAPLNLEVGVHHLDGISALRYVRSRRQGVDFDRAQRQQKLLRSLMEQHLNLELVFKLPQLWETFNDTVQTDLTLPEIVQLAYFGLQVKQNRIKSRFIDWRVTDNFVTAGGAQVLLPNREKLPQAVAEFLNPPREDLHLMAEGARIEILNASSTQDLEKVAAKRLERQGLKVIRIDTSRATPKTSVLVYTDRPYTLQTVLALLKLDTSRVVRLPGSANDVDIQVILGDDWGPCQ